LIGVPLTDSLLLIHLITNKRIPDTTKVLMMIYNTHAGSKLNAVFKYSKNDATIFILSLHRDIGNNL
jgi:hypothetical protein